MVQISEDTLINSSASSVFNFLTRIDSLYKIWHPKDHVFCKAITGSLAKKGAVFHFLEILGGFPLYLIVKVTEFEKDQYIAYRPIFPLSLLNLGWGYFRVKSISPNQSQLTAFVEYGYKSKWFDRFANLFVKVEVAKKHIHEEGENLKSFLEKKQV